jgi:magnesium transporter
VYGAGVNAVSAEHDAVSVVVLDFARRTERCVDLDVALEAMRQGACLWIDIDTTNPEVARRVFAELPRIEEETLDDALSKEPTTQLARYDDYLHFVVAGCRQRDSNFELERVDAVVLERCFVTLHRGPVLFLNSMRRGYRAAFARFAQTPSFLVFEIWDHLIENYLDVQKLMEERVEELQNELRTGVVGDAAFARLSDLGAELLHFRKVLLPARAVLTDLATRRSLFVSEVTQTFLANMAGKLEHVLQDLLVDRDILSESLNLYMSIVSHRTNEVMKRLTVVSLVFLPLTFICGVYGMNFEHLPELHWAHGYVFFWALVVVVVIILLALTRRAKLW